MNFLFFVRSIFLLYTGTGEEVMQTSSYQHSGISSSPVKYWDSGKVLIVISLNPLQQLVIFSFFHSFHFTGIVNTSVNPDSATKMSRVSPTSAANAQGIIITQRQYTLNCLTPVFQVIRGADIVARTTVEITPDQPLDFHWEGHGFKVHIPAGAITREWGRVTLCIQASLSGDYQLPDDGVLVSGVYWLSLHPYVERFDKKITISLQHCASDDDSSITFVTAKCIQETLPYTFKPLPGGVFSEKESSIQVYNITAFAAILRESPYRKWYVFRVFYIRKQTPNEYEAYITVADDLELHRKVST